MSANSSATASEAYAYDDLSGTRRGPFARESYVAWFRAGFLRKSHELIVVGGARDGERVCVEDIVDERARNAGVEARGDGGGDGDGKSERSPERTALDARLMRLLERGKGTLPTIEQNLSRARVSVDGGETRNVRAMTTSVTTTPVTTTTTKAKTRARARTWRDILSATRARVAHGRARMVPIKDENSMESRTIEVALDVANGARDPREDYRELLRDADAEEGAVPEPAKPIDLREPFWVLEDRATKGASGGVIDAEALNAAVAEQLANERRATAAAAIDADASSDRSDISWSAKPGGLERQARRAEEREAALFERRAAEEAAAVGYDLYEDDTAGAALASEIETLMETDDNAAERARLNQKREMLAYYTENPRAGQWWLPDDNNGGAPTLGPFGYDELTAKLPHIMVAHRRDDDAWTVVGPYSERDKVENYGRAAHGAAVALRNHDAETDYEAARERDLQTSAWFAAVTEMIDIEDDLKVPSKAEPSETEASAIKSWFAREMSKVKLDTSELSSMFSKPAHVGEPRRRRRGFELRVTADDVQNHTAARVIGELYKNLMKNRKRLFASIVEPVLDDWDAER